MIARLGLAEDENYPAEERHAARNEGTLLLDRHPAGRLTEKYVAIAAYRASEWKRFAGGLHSRFIEPEETSTRSRSPISRDIDFDC